MKMNYNIISKNKNIIGTIILIVGFVLIYKFSGLNSKAANSYSCNYYVGRCFVDNKFGKNNNKDNCDKECLSNRYKYYFNKTANACVLDFRGTYNTKKECTEASLRSVQCKCDEKSGTCVSANDGSSFLYGGMDYDSCRKNCRPLYKAYECDQVAKKCNLVAKGDDKAKLTYEGCWTYCMGQSLGSLPVETLYGCSKAGYCVPNPSGGFKSYDECNNDSTCKLVRMDYEEKITTRYRWDDTLKKCVLDKDGSFESWGECRAVKEGIGSEFIYMCEEKKCVQKTYNDLITASIRSSDKGAMVSYEMPDMSCDISDKCIIERNTGKGNLVFFMTQNACQKECEKTTSNNQLTGDSLCVINYLREVPDQSCSTSNDCKLADENCVSKSNKTYVATDGYSKVDQALCTKNQISYGDYGDKCECVSKRCVLTNLNKPRMICGDKLCDGVESKALLYRWMTRSTTGEYKLVQPEENRYYCPQDCK